MGEGGKNRNFGKNGGLVSGRKHFGGECIILCWKPGEGGQKTGTKKGP